MEQMQMNKPDIYDAALYLRLSKDDVEKMFSISDDRHFGEIPI